MLIELLTMCRRFHVNVFGVHVQNLQCRIAKNVQNVQCQIAKNVQFSVVTELLTICRLFSVELLG